VEAQAYARFLHVNTLQRDLCPSMSHMEYEIITMTADLLHGSAVSELDPNQKVCGVIGAGGTESILNAVLGYRNWAHSRGIEHPQMILPDTAHPAFLKGAHLFGLELVVVPTDPVSTLVDPAAVRAAITPRTAVIVGSAGNYAYGTIDPIEALSTIAVETGVGLHVDGCLGGWILPWGQRLGYANIPVFDFRLPGVTSISADTHKYGYGPKGVSVLLWRDASYRRHHYFVEPDWNGGIYASAALLGSRSGGSSPARGRHAPRAHRLSRQARHSTPRWRSGAPRTPALTIAGDRVLFRVRPTRCVYTAMNNGWQFNGLQHPAPALRHRPQTQPGWWRPGRRSWPLVWSTPERMPVMRRGAARCTAAPACRAMPPSVPARRRSAASACSSTSSPTALRHDVSAVTSPGRAPLRRPSRGHQGRATRRARYRQYPPLSARSDLQFHPMSRQCSRTGCAELATVTLSYQYARSIVWLDDLYEEREPHAYDLCQRHTARLSVPNGWRLEDRRTSRQLIAAGAANSRMAG
jgi:hypothetical protein